MGFRGTHLEQDQDGSLTGAVGSSLGSLAYIELRNTLRAMGRSKHGPAHLGLRSLRKVTMKVPFAQLWYPSNSLRLPEKAIQAPTALIEPSQSQAR